MKRLVLVGALSAMLLAAYHEYVGEGGASGGYGIFTPAGSILFLLEGLAGDLPLPPFPDSAVVDVIYVSSATTPDELEFLGGGC